MLKEIYKKANLKSKIKNKIGIYLSKKVIERARFHNLNISRIPKQALTSVLDYLEPQNNKQSSKFLSTGFFLKESVMVPRAELEPATNGDITL